ncbi:hypothetical protein [Accumulibacter sp.]|uniref:hypothetical protein n=1 Tax=Accumulibacter sp. TaxID=2053492 RepID=UPI00262A241B|nr:hypothetical protein [Accumulibacter sp.]
MDFNLLTSVSWNELPILVFAALLGLVFALVIRQNQKDYLELMGILASEYHDLLRGTGRQPPAA